MEVVVLGVVGVIVSVVIPGGHAASELSETVLLAGGVIEGWLGAHDHQ